VPSSKVVVPRLRPREDNSRYPVLCQDAVEVKAAPDFG
jgi:hypothetical protein